MRGACGAEAAGGDPAPGHPFAFHHERLAVTLWIEAGQLVAAAHPLPPRHREPRFLLDRLEVRPSAAFARIGLVLEQRRTRAQPRERFARSPRRTGSRWQRARRSERRFEAPKRRWSYFVVFS